MCVCLWLQVWVHLHTCPAPSRTSCSPANPRSHCFHTFSPFVLKCCEDFCAQRSNLGEPEIFHLRPRPWGTGSPWILHEGEYTEAQHKKFPMCVCFLTNSVLQSRPSGCSDVQFQGGERNLCHLEGAAMAACARICLKTRTRLLGGKDNSKSIQGLFESDTAEREETVFDPHNGPVDCDHLLLVPVKATDVQSH